MKTPVIAACFLAAALACCESHAEECSGSPRHALLLHGGFLDYEEEVEPAHRELLKRLLAAGNARLAAGGSALDAVTEAIAAMEDSGLLDAGKGSIVNTEGFTETDASLMDGVAGRSGAVAAMQRLKNPIRAARLVMDRSKHVLFAGTTGEATLQKLGAEVIDPATYYQEYVPPPKPPPPEAGPANCPGAWVTARSSAPAPMPTPAWRCRPLARASTSSNGQPHGISPCVCST